MLCHKTWDITGWNSVAQFSSINSTGIALLKHKILPIIIQFALLYINVC